MMKPGLMTQQQITGQPNAGYSRYRFKIIRISSIFFPCSSSFAPLKSWFEQVNTKTVAMCFTFMPL